MLRTALPVLENEQAVSEEQPLCMHCLLRMHATQPSSAQSHSAFHPACMQRCSARESSFKAPHGLARAQMSRKECQKHWSGRPRSPWYARDGPVLLRAD